MLLNPFTLHSPKTLGEAADLVHCLKDAKVLAGGTFLLNTLKVLKKKGLKTPSQVISLRKIPELKGMSLSGDELVIKSMTTINELFSSPLLTGHFSALKTVSRELGTNPIRNMATVGGNLTCRYTWTELGAVMLALDAQFHFAGQGGKKEIISAEKFFQDSAKTADILSHITIKKEDHSRSVYQRVNKSSKIDVPLLAVCVKAVRQGNRLSNARVAVNTVTAFSQRDHALEDFLNHSSVEPSLPEKILERRTESIYATTDEYKQHMFGVCLKNAIQELFHG